MSPHRFAALLALLLAAAPLAAARAGDLAAEYGPEAEARFVALCAEQPGASEAGCRGLAERLQARLGYAAFLAGAAGGPAGFGAEATEAVLPAVTVAAAPR